MPLNKRNIGVVSRTVFAGFTETITLLKRNNDQQQGTQAAYTLFRCRQSMVSRTGEPIRGDMTSNHSTTWHIPYSELKRNGISHINALDRIVQKNGDTWQAESTTEITEKLLGQEIDVNCLRTDPPQVYDGLP